MSVFNISYPWVLLYRPSGPPKMMMAPFGHRRSIIQWASINGHQNSPLKMGDRCEGDRIKKLDGSITLSPPRNWTWKWAITPSPLPPFLKKFSCTSFQFSFLRETKCRCSGCHVDPLMGKKPPASNSIMTRGTRFHEIGRRAFTSWPSLSATDHDYISASKATHFPERFIKKPYHNSFLRP